MVGLLVALYSGINWMGNLREAIRPVARRLGAHAAGSGKIWVKYFRDFISLIGLLVALVVTLVDHLRRRFGPADDYLRALSR
jgi:membrane protein